MFLNKIIYKLYIKIKLILTESKILAIILLKSIMSAIKQKRGDRKKKLN